MKFIYFYWILVCCKHCLVTKLPNYFVKNFMFIRYHFWFIEFYIPFYTIKLILLTYHFCFYLGHRYRWTKGGQLGLYTSMDDNNQWADSRIYWAKVIMLSWFHPSIMKQKNILSKSQLISMSKRFRVTCLKYLLIVSSTFAVERSF